MKAAIGEDATDEELGGAEMHAEVTGLGEYLGENDAHAIALARELMDKLPWDTVPAQRATFEEPRFAAEELLGIVPADEREPYDVREVIARLVDGSRLPRVQARLRQRDGLRPRAPARATRSASSATTARSSPNGSTKAAQFIQLCDQSGTPLRLPAEHHRLHGRHAPPSAAASSSTARR